MEKKEGNTFQSQRNFEDQETPGVQKAVIQKSTLFQTDNIMPPKRKRSPSNAPMHKKKLNEQRLGAMAGRSRAGEPTPAPDRIIRGPVSTSGESREPGEPHGKVQQASEARGKPETCSTITESVSSFSAKDEPAYLSNVTVEIGGKEKYLCAAVLDTGCMPSLVGESIARRAVHLKLATIEPGNLEQFEGVVKGPKLSSVGKIRFRFFIDDFPYFHYRNTFFVIPDDERFEMLIGGKFIKRCRLLEAGTKLAEALAARL